MFKRRQKPTGDPRVPSYLPSKGPITASEVVRIEGERLAQRFSQHLIANGGRFTQKELEAAERFAVKGGKTAREIAEQQKIDKLGGIGHLLNHRNPIGPRRYGLMPQGYSR